MKAGEFKQKFDSIQEKSNVVMIESPDCLVYADHFEFPYHVIGTKQEAGADITLFYGGKRVAYMKLKSVDTLMGCMS